MEKQEKKKISLSFLKKCYTYKSKEDHWVMWKRSDIDFSKIHTLFRFSREIDPLFF
jgi:hypothetical protein